MLFPSRVHPPQQPVLNKTVHDHEFVSDTPEEHVDLHICRRGM